MRLTLFILALLFATPLAAQDFRADLNLLRHQTENDNPLKATKKKTGFRPAAILYGSTLGFYQKQISPQWGANCAFEITCSHFSKQLVEEYGLLKGFFLTMDRLGRCNKISFYETLPIRINSQNKIVDQVAFYQ